jgi:4-hydroxy-tetrahydrodipicolinate synthase
MALPYPKAEARSWARETMRGVANVLTPTFTSDLSGLNEEAVRHDVRLEIEYGFWGALLVAETATTLDEYVEFAAWAADEARDRLHLIHHASFNTLEENIEAAQRVGRAGAELVLLGYPPSFYPKNEDELFDYTAAFCDGVDLGVILFPVPLWGFERIHPAAGFSPELLERMVDTIPSVVAVKAEGGMPWLGGFSDAHRRVGDRVLVTEPLEGNGIPMASLVSMPFMGTSNYEYFGDVVPRMFRSVQSGDVDAAMELYWRIHPGRQANLQAMSMLAGSNFLHRMLWKYQGWLQGFNGGPLRTPTMRIADRQMKGLRQGLVASGFELEERPDAEFFIGRNPK